MNITTLPLHALHLDPKPPRTHDALNIETIRRSLAAFGQIRPLLVQATTHRLIAGAATVQAMRRLGWHEAACLVLDLDDRRAELLSLLDNRAADLAAWDEDYLACRLNDLRHGGATDLTLSGFTPVELHVLMDTRYSLYDLAAGLVPAEAFATAATVTASPGDATP